MSVEQATGAFQKVYDHTMADRPTGPKVDFSERLGPPETPRYEATDDLP